MEGADKAVGLSHHCQEERNTNVGEGRRRPPPAPTWPPTPSPPPPAPPRCQETATGKRHHRARLLSRLEMQVCPSHLGLSRLKVHGCACRGASAMRGRASVVVIDSRSPSRAVAPRRWSQTPPPHTHGEVSAAAVAARALPSGISGGNGKGRNGGGGGLRPPAWSRGRGNGRRRRFFFHVLCQFMEVVMIISKASFDS
jgi:hypothetical protein